MLCFVEVKFFMCTILITVVIVKNISHFYMAFGLSVNSNETYLRLKDSRIELEFSCNFGHNLVIDSLSLSFSFTSHVLATS